MSPLAAPSGRAAWTLWALAVGAVLLCRLGGAPLFDIDEGAFAEATREMLASGDWLHTTLNGADRFDKPILVYWLQAVSIGLLGTTEAAARLPSALCAWGWCVALAHFARPRFGAATAMAAGSLLAASVGVLAIGRAATADALLNLLLALTLFDLWRHLESGSRTALRRAALFAGLGVLTKGPIALLVPGATLVLWVLVQRQPRRLLGVLRDPVAWALLVGVSVPWYAYALHRHGQAFIDGFLMRHNVERFSGTLENHAGGPLYYAVVLPLLLLPWTPLLVAGLWRLRGLWREPLGAWLLVWAAFVVGFFSLSGTKLPHYVLYGATPLALIAARALAAPLSAGLQRVQAATLVVALVLLAAAPYAAVQAAASIRKPVYRLLIEGTALPPAWPAVLAIVAVLFAIGYGLRRGRPAEGLLAATAVFALFVTAVVQPWWGEALQGPVRRAADAARAERARDPTAALIQWGVSQPSFAYAAGTPVPRREPRPGDLVLTRTDRVPTGVAPLYAERGYALIRWPG